MPITTKWISAVVLASGLLSAGAIAYGKQQAAPLKVHFDSLDVGKDGQPVKLDGYLYKPADKASWPAVVMFHSCALPISKSGKVKLREREVAQELVKMGYGVLLVDSLASRGVVQSMCGTPVSSRPVRGRSMRLDGYGALDYLNSRSDVQKGKVAAFGQTFAGVYALNAVDTNLLPYGKTKSRFAAAFSLAPSCKSVLKRKAGFQAYAPVLLLAGAADDKRPSKYCEDLAAQNKSKGASVTVHSYADAQGGFYLDDAHGGNGKDRADAYQRIDAFLKSSFSKPAAKVAAVPASTIEPDEDEDVSDEDLNPEAGSGFIAKKAAHAKHFMLASANPLATEAGYEILRKGGSAVDAVIATQMVLTLVEPQSSGIGGGAFVVYYDKGQKLLTTYDGRETAPAAATPERFMPNGKLLPFRASVNSGLSVGVPGVLRALEMAHGKYGKLPWAELFKPAIKLAENGFHVSPRLHTMIEESKGLSDQKAAAAYFFDAAGKPWPVGHLLKNPELAKVLRQVAEHGAAAFYTGDIAQAIVTAVHGHSTPGDMTLADLADYRAKQREPLCGNYRVYRICGMPPPSSGVLGVLELLGVLEYAPMQKFAPESLKAVHYFSEAGRLAYADRDYYAADPDFIPMPTKALVSPAYLKSRFALIDPDHSMGVAKPGDPAAKLAMLGRDNAPEIPSTSHIVAVDSSGDVVSMTTTIESEFGSKLFVKGFLLNNQLTDFSRDPVDEDGKLVANRVQPNKRPRSTMAPIIVFRNNEPYMAVGSPGGSAIINYVAKTLVGVLDWKLDVQQAISLPNFGSRNKQTELEAGTDLVKLVKPLEAMGHDVRMQEFPSGVQAIVIDRSGLTGGADPRREGWAKGD